MPFFEVLVGHKRNDGSRRDPYHRIIVEASEQSVVEKALTPHRHGFPRSAPWGLCSPCTGEHTFEIVPISPVHLG